MDRRQELERKIEELKAILRNYLDNEKNEEEIYKLSSEIDTLIVEYYNLTKKL